MPSKWSNGRGDGRPPALSNISYGHQSQRSPGCPQRSPLPHWGFLGPATDGRLPEAAVSSTLTFPSATSTRWVMWRPASSRLSWVTMRSVPSYEPRAASSCSMAGRSRWLVGSSSTKKLTPVAWKQANWAGCVPRGTGCQLAAPHRERPGRTWPGAIGPQAPPTPLPA